MRRTVRRLGLSVEERLSHACRGAHERPVLGVLRGVPRLAPLDRIGEDVLRRSRISLDGDDGRRGVEVRVVFPGGMHRDGALDERAHAVLRAELQDSLRIAFEREHGGLVPADAFELRLVDDDVSGGDQPLADRVLRLGDRRGGRFALPGRMQHEREASGFRERRRAAHRREEEECEDGCCEERRGLRALHAPLPNPARRRTHGSPPSSTNGSVRASHRKNADTSGCRRFEAPT